MLKKPKPIPEVFSENSAESLNEKNRVKLTYDQATEVDLGAGVSLQSPELPKYYDRLSLVDTSKVLSKQRVYTLIEKFTPYLIQNLLYLSQNKNVSPHDRINASKILLDKILPSLSAEHIQLDSDNLQSLVIVKSKKSE